MVNSWLTKIFFLRVPLYAWLVLLLFFLPFIILYQNIPIVIHDSFDCGFVYFHLLKITHTVLDFSSGTMIDQIMNGVPRSSLPTGLNFISFLYAWFDSFNAFLINFIIVHLVAFIGMFLLLDKLHGENQNKHIIVVTSLCFALLPYFTFFGLSIAGQPLLLFAFLNILDRKASFSDYLIIALFPFYSAFVLVGPFIICAIALLLIINFIQVKKINWSYLSGIILLVLCYSIAEFNLIRDMFVSNTIISHRTEFIYMDTIFTCIKTAFETFVFGNYEAQSLPTFFIILPVLYSLFLNKTDINLKRNTIYILIFIAIFSLFTGFWTWTGWGTLREKVPIVNIFNISRFYYLFPLLWYILFSFSLNFILKIKFGKQITAFLLCAQLIFIVANNYEYKNLVRKTVGIKTEAPSFREFFAEALFKQIKNDIGIPQKDYRVVSIGIPPTISQYSGFYSLDSYLTSYQLAYKHQFRKIIEKELDKNSDLKNYFDNWGSRCYVFSDEVGKKAIITKNNDKKAINNLALNTDVLKEMGGKYIFSALEIKNFKENNLTFLKVYKSDTSIWNVYVYEVN